MASYSINVKQDLAGSMERHILKTPLVRNNQYAHVFNVEVTNNGVPYPVGSVEANFVQSNGMTVPLDSTYCSSSGNVATVRLPQACYTVPGRAILVINCESDGGITCIAWFDCTVLNGSTENALDPGTIIPSVEALIDRIDDAVESIPADYSQLLASISSNFSTGTSYAAGAYVWYPGLTDNPGALYRFTSAHSGTWTGTDAVVVSIGNELNDTVRYTQQVHTDAEKAIARTNMGAAAAADLTALSNSVGTVPSGTTVENQIFSQGTQISTNASNIDALQRQVGTVPTGETVEGQITDLKSAVNYGTYSYLGKLNDQTIDHNGIQWNISDGVIHANPGTATNTSFVRLYYNTAKLIDGIEAGETYTAYFQTSNTNVKLRIYYYVNGSIIDENVYTSRTIVFTVPSGVTGMQVRAEIAKNVVIENVEYAVAKILQYPSNKELKSDIELCEDGLRNTNHAFNDSNPDLLPLITISTYINKGITFSFVSDVNIVANGTATDSARYNIYFNTSELLPGVVAGGQYFIAYKTSDNNLKLRIMFYKNGEAYGTTVYATGDRFVDIPDDAEGMGVALSVSSGVTLTNATITKYGLLKDPDNEYIYTTFKDTYLPYNRLDNAVDPDSLTENGIWLVYKANTNHNPFDGATNYMLEVVHPYAGACIQKAVSVDASKIKFRTQYANSWSAWNSVLTDVYEINYADLDVGVIIKMNLDAVFFNKNGRTSQNASFASKIVPVKSGDYIYLHVIAGTSAAKPYAIIGNDLLVSYTYTSGAAFNGYISITADGFIAINTKVENSGDFECRIYRADVESKIRDTLFTDPIRDRLDTSYKFRSENPCSVLKVGPSMAAAIHHWGVIGASYDSGTLNFTNADNTLAGLDYYEYSWGQCFKRMNNIVDLYNYSNGGQHTKEWLIKTNNDSRGHAFTTDEEVWLSYHDAQHNYPWYGGHGPGGGCWWKVKADHENGNTKQAFVVVLGSNDIGIRHPHDANWNTLTDYDPTLYYEEGSIEDIGTYDLETDTDTPPAGKTAGDVPGIVNSYAGYMGAILNRIIAIQPRCVIFLATIRNNFGQNERSLEIWNKYNAILRQIVEMPQFANNCILIDYGKYGPNYYAPSLLNMEYGHPNAFGYQLAAYYYNTLIDNAIMQNLTKIPNPTWIGTDRTQARG